ncbi:MAG: hypothetical protein ABIT96_03735 [Ferruginibacter sp.]
MKLSFLSFIALAILGSFSASAQTADEIVNKYVAAMGGAEKLSSLQSVQMSGTISVQGNDFGIAITRMQNVGMRVDMDIMGSENYQVVNTKSGSQFMPVMGMQAPQPMEDDQYKTSRTQLDLQGLLFNYKSKGVSLETAGTETVNGNAAQKLIATLQDGSKVNFFIDNKTGFVVKTSATRNIGGQQMNLETTLEDYRQTAEGYWFPYKTTNSQGTMNFDKVEANVKVDPAIFN